MTTFMRVVQVRRSTVLADVRRRAPSETAVVQTGRRCRNCPRVGAADEWPRAPGPFSSPAFATGVTIAVLVSAVVMYAVVSA